MMFLLELIPGSFRKYIYGALALGVLALTIWWQNARIDSLKAQRDTLKAEAATLSAAYSAETKKLRMAYDAANEAIANYNAAKDKAAATVTVYKERIVHVYEKNPDVRALLDQHLPCDLLDGMCNAIPGSCDLSSPIEAAAGADGTAPAAASAAACDITVRDLVNNFGEVRGAYSSAAARHDALVEYLNKTGD